VIVFAWPWVLVLVIPTLAGWLTVVRRRRQRIPGLAVEGRLVGTVSSGITIWMGLVGLAALWVAAARPARPGLTTEHAPARNIMLVLDLSASMGQPAGDTPRAAAARKAIETFLRLRRHDRVGLVVFARHAAVVAPLTRDHRAILALAENLQPGELSPGTAIGDALAVALERLHSSQGESAVVLISDGEHNAGFLQPETAAAIAARRQVTVDTILVGSSSEGRAQMAALSSATGGHTVHADDAGSLDRAFRQLSRLRPSPGLQPHIRWESLAHWPGGAGALLLLGTVLAELASRRAWP
jgi:Ca-activated chloride channel homolog